MLSARFVNLPIFPALWAEEQEKKCLPGFLNAVFIALLTKVSFEVFKNKVGAFWIATYPCLLDAPPQQPDGPMVPHLPPAPVVTGLRTPQEVEPRNPNGHIFFHWPELHPSFPSNFASAKFFKD